MSTGAAGRPPRLPATATGPRRFVAGRLRTHGRTGRSMRAGRPTWPDPSRSSEARCWRWPRSPACTCPACWCADAAEGAAVQPWYRTWWSYYRAIDLPQVRPYATKIRFAAALGVGLAWWRCAEAPARRRPLRPRRRPGAPRTAPRTCSSRTRTGSWRAGSGPSRCGCRAAVREICWTLRRALVQDRRSPGAVPASAGSAVRVDASRRRTDGRGRPRFAFVPAVPTLETRAIRRRCARAVGSVSPPA